MRRRRRRSLFDEFFSPFEEFEEAFGRAFQGFGGLTSGYSIEVRQEGGRTTVHAKVGKDVDARKLRKELERQYPGAQIVIEGGRPIIEEVKEEVKKKKEPKKPVKVPIKWLEPEEEPLIKEEEES